MSLLKFHHLPHTPRAEVASAYCARANRQTERAPASVLAALLRTRRRFFLGGGGVRFVPGAAWSVRGFPRLQDFLC